MERNKVKKVKKEGVKCKECKKLEIKVKELEDKFKKEVLDHCNNVIESGAYLSKIGELQAVIAAQRKQKYDN